MPVDLNNMTRICSCYHRSQGTSRLPAYLPALLVGGCRPTCVGVALAFKPRRISYGDPEVSHWLKFVRQTDRVLNRASAERIISATRSAFAVWSTRHKSKPQNSRGLTDRPVWLVFTAYCIMRWRFLHHPSVFRKYLHESLELVTLAGGFAYTPLSSRCDVARRQFLH